MKKDVDACICHLHIVFYMVDKYIMGCCILPSHLQRNIKRKNPHPPLSCKHKQKTYITLRWVTVDMSMYLVCEEHMKGRILMVRGHHFYAELETVLK